MGWRANSKELIPKVHCKKVYSEWLLWLNYSLSFCSVSFKFETLKLSKNVLISHKLGFLPSLEWVLLIYWIDIDFGDKTFDITRIWRRFEFNALILYSLIEVFNKMKALFIIRMNCECLSIFINFCTTIKKKNNRTKCRNKNQKQ